MRKKNQCHVDRKKYFVDTNVLIEDPKAVEVLRNGDDNKVFIALQTLIELSYLKKEPRVSYLVKRVMNELENVKSKFKMSDLELLIILYPDHQDLKIIQEIFNGNNTDAILVTNDVILRKIAETFGIKSEKYLGSLPFRSEAENFTGFSDEEITNTFFMSSEDKPVMRSRNGYKTIDYQHKIWSVSPKNIFQNLAMELLIDPDIDIVSLQSEAGYGKTYLALAAALYLMLEKKQYEKIICTRPLVESGPTMGLMPGNVEEKFDPYVKNITQLVKKLHKVRHANRLFLNKNPLSSFDPEVFEYIPVNFMQGMNIENSIVIIDEVQDFTREQCRTILSRMCEGVKCFCLGDTRQIKHPYLNMENNGLNWIVSKFKGSSIYAHLVLKGNKSRGPITDLVIQSGL
jgi:PhoH-like ATPase